MHDRVSPLPFSASQAQQEMPRIPRTRGEQLVRMYL